MKNNTETLEHPATETQDGKRTPNPIRKAATAFALVIGLLLSSAVVSPTQADAHTGGHSSCIQTTNTGFWGTTTRATNNCGHTVNIKIERIGKSDSACHGVRAGSALRWNQGFWGTNRSTGVPC